MRKSRFPEERQVICVRNTASVMRSSAMGRLRIKLPAISETDIMDRQFLTGPSPAAKAFSLHPVVDLGLIGVKPGLRLGRAMATNNATHSGEATCASSDDQ